MVIRRLIGIAIITVAILTVALETQAATSLENARSELASGHATDARKIYKQIEFSSADWPSKVEDLVRLDLQEGQPLEAWRSIQVAQRVRTFDPQWVDYERLAIFQAGGCPLALTPANESQSYLLNAAVFRFMPTFYSEDINVPLENNPSESALAPGLTHYLADIPNAEIRRDSGCRLAKTSARRLKTPAANELDQLRNFLGTLPPGDKSQPRLLVTIRALELATTPEVNDTGLASSFKSNLPSVDEMPWNDFPDPERQWLFVQLFKARTLKEVAAEQRPKAEAIARAALDAPQASPLWISLIDFASEPSAKRAALLSKVEKLGPFKARAWLLFELARARFENNDVVGSLTILRRLLVEHEEPVEPNLEDACVNLASQIFAENRLDSKNLGAIEAALPARLWNSLFKKAELHAAIVGRLGEFKTLEDLRRHRSGRDFGAAEETSLLQALAQRNLNVFGRELADSSAGAGRPLIAIARAMAGDLIGNPTPSAHPFADAVAKKLQSLRSVSDEEERSDLVQLLSSTSANAQIKAAKSVRQGVIQLGTSRWATPDLRPADLALAPPSVLPRRDLYYVPDPHSIRGWIFSTAKH